MAADVILTPMDVERLLRDDSPDSRASVLEKIVQGYNAANFRGRERDIAEQVFRLLMKDVALRVRETLAERIKDNADVPRDIVLHLANDVESVAGPVLVSSVVLSDADLVEIVEKSHDMGKLLAITQREAVSPRVSDALVETRYAQVMQSLLSNEGATISDRAFEKIAEDFRGDDGVMTALSKKPKLPITVVERIITQVSSAVAEELKGRYQLSDSDLAGNASHAREDFMVRLLENQLPDDEIEALVVQMAREERLTPSIVMTALCRGQLMFFTTALAQFAGIPVANARRLVADRGAHGFNGLYEKSGLPDSMMDAVRLLLRAVQDMASDGAIPGSMLYANRLAERVIGAAGAQPVEYLPYFIALVRQNPQRH
ncbi:MAG: DUF2336 domain-containing protein [Alphaproteobacteria bacterium]|nr:DUF2336 domain-containing protein [Alphaproteobacteria bacterium]